MLSGILNIYKPISFSSAHIVSTIKKALIIGGEDKKIKIGHLGTLDPAAEGVLPIAIGRATRLFKYHLEENKEYLARFRFGYTTDTLDSEGKIVKTSNILPNSEEIIKILPLLMGKYVQIPPKYSAKTVGGIRAYSLARKGIDFELSGKEIIVNNITLNEQNSDDEFSFLINCSAGTYIRSIVRDMAKLLSTEATMTFLKRIRSGIFSIESALSIENINIEIIKNNILSLDECFPNYPSLILSSDEIKYLLDGKSINKQIRDISGRIKVISDKILVGIGIICDNNLKIETWLK